VNLSMLFKGAEAAAYLWQELAELGPAGLHPSADAGGR